MCGFDENENQKGDNIARDDDNNCQAPNHMLRIKSESAFLFSEA